MLNPKHLATLALAFVVFTLLPTMFWATLTYWVINPMAAKIVGISFFLAGLFTCYRGSRHNYRWFKE